MSFNGEKLGIENIENGRTKNLINQYLLITSRDIDNLENVHGLNRGSLKGKVTVQITLQAHPKNDEHYIIHTEVSRVIPKVSNESLAIDNGYELLVDPRGSDSDSPYQKTIESEIEENERIDFETGEVITLKKKG